MINLFKKAAGSEIVALIDHCRMVDELIAGRKLGQLKPVATPLGDREMPKFRYFGADTYYGSVLNLFYAFQVSYICLAVGAKTLVGGWGVIGGVVLFALLMVMMRGVEKGSTFSLRWLVSLWLLLSVCQLLVAVWLLFNPFSWPGLTLWSVSLLMLWLGRRGMNGSELKKVMQWRLSLKTAMFRRLALTQPKLK